MKLKAKLMIEIKRSKEVNCKMNILNVLTTCVSIRIIIASICVLIGGLLYFIKFVWEFITDWKYKNKKHWK